ncbi:MAG: bifunctional 5,10-methylenetetrahydrofolate dehydrogenase/5,10-methenyltetrahydrofolate cyclohydrolase [Deltaproteobacteria bacterium]|nr:bifunctional 5,10-methylenetetrahydrofolate dehydrogenase/5,10-methenyltetrahydrofolate cyclohydrolase [Deltaproteobacteria bacterium]
MPTKPSSLIDPGLSSGPPAPLGRILDGKIIAREIRAQVRSQVDRLLREHRLRPGLDVILVGADAASTVYVASKQRACEEVGIDCRVHHFSIDISEDELVHFIYQLNRNPECHGILLQLPLPERALEAAALAELAPEKDVDGLNPLNQARLLAGERGLRPCTPLGVVELIKRTGMDPEGKRAVIVGTSALVGKPLAFMLLELNATVVFCHEFTRDLSKEVAGAEILVSAVGRAGLIRGEWIGQGAVVIDAGISRDSSGIRGDVEFEKARERAGFITPVPGGVGPMTVAMLTRNTLLIAEQITMQASRSSLPSAAKK